MTQHLQTRLGQPIVIDNRPGGGTSIGTKAAAIAEPDGYTLLFISSALVIDPAMKKVDYDPLKDFAPVATVDTTSWLIAVSPSLPVEDDGGVRRLHQGPSRQGQLRAHPRHRRACWSASGSSSSAAPTFSIPYKGGAAALPDFLGGRIQMLIPTPSTSLPLIRDGKMRPLADHQRRRAAPTCRMCRPRARSGLPELTLEFWAGVLAPAGTPPEIVGKLNAAINDSLRRRR